MENMQDNSQLGNKGIEEKAPLPLTDEQKTILKIYRAKSGNISETCIAGKISRPIFYKWLKNLNFKSEVDDIDEEELDFAESQLRFLMKGQYTLIYKKDANGNPIPGEYEVDSDGEPLRQYHIPIDNASVIFKLKTKGKKRGYMYRTEITGAEGSAIGFDINILPKKKKSE